MEGVFFMHWFPYIYHLPSDESLTWLFPVDGVEELREGMMLVGKGVPILPDQVPMLRTQLLTVR